MQEYGKRSEQSNTGGGALNFYRIYSPISHTGESFFLMAMAASKRKAVAANQTAIDQSTICHTAVIPCSTVIGVCSDLFRHRTYQTSLRQKSYSI